MTVEQEQHIEGLLKAFSVEAKAKYAAGAAEHASNLWDVPTLKLIDHAIEEAIDQVMYLYTLREKMNNGQ